MNNLIILLMLYIQGKDWIRACELYDVQTVIVAQYIIEHTSIYDIYDLVTNCIIIAGQDINKYRAEIAEIERKIAEVY